MLLLSIILTNYLALTYAKPEQIHLSLGGNASEMMVTWTTFTKPKLSSTVIYNKINGPVNHVKSEVTHFNEDKNYKAYIHRARLVGLEHGVTYEYKCETDGLLSETFKFKPISDSPDTSVRLAIFGDLGLESGVSIPQLKSDVKQGLYDAILHIGDIAYNLDKNNGTVGDNFMNAIEPIAANVPYQVCPGNHERKHNFTHYKNRFTMNGNKIGNTDNHFHSFNMGSAHFIMFSTELYYWPEFFTQQNIKYQYDWIENDLKIATKPENRLIRPWIIVLGHRPMYCLENSDDCSHYETMIRKGRTGLNLKVETLYGLEDLFTKYGVDIEFYGHKHLYQRTYPISDFQIYNNTGYNNAKAPIHITTGAAGTIDRAIHKTNLPNWVAFYSGDYSFTRMNVQNKTHISIEQISVEHGSKVIDSFVVKKDKRLF